MPERRPRGKPRSGRPHGPKSKVDAARLAAYDVVESVRADDAYTNLVLPGLLSQRGVTGRDAAFSTELASGTIRAQGTYDSILAACIDRPLAKVQGKVLSALRLGVHQLLAMRVPDHAAISTSVDLVRARVGQGPAGFTNAVLRKVSARDLDAWVEQLAPDATSDPVGHAAMVHAHPRWVVEALAEALGQPAGSAELEELLRADNAPPKVMLVARPGLAEVSELVEAGGVATGRSPYAVELPGGDPGAVAAVAQGRAGVQDEGSQRVALALADARLEGRDEQWLDLCAGPGGKSALLAAVAATRGAHLLASERQEHRARLVVRGTAAAAAGLSGVITADGTRPAWRAASFDRVLVDAPCSGLGALRRRPESRWRRQPSDLETLVPLQRALLDSALTSVRPGGVVVYATCSPVIAETTGVVDAVLGERDDVRLESSEQLWPHLDGCDAMYWAVLRRVA